MCITNTLTNCSPPLIFLKKKKKSEKYYTFQLSLFLWKMLEVMKKSSRVEWGLLWRHESSLSLEEWDNKLHKFYLLMVLLEECLHFKVLVSLFVTYFSYDIKCDDKFLYLFLLRQHPLLRKQLLSAKGGGRLAWHDWLDWMIIHE